MSAPEKSPELTLQRVALLLFPLHVFLPLSLTLPILETQTEEQLFRYPPAPSEPKALNPKTLQSVSRSPSHQISMSKLKGGIGECLVQSIHFTDEKLRNVHKREIIYLRSHVVKNMSWNL